MENPRDGSRSGHAWLGVALCLLPFLLLAIPDSTTAPRPESLGTNLSASEVTAPDARSDRASEKGALAVTTERSLRVEQNDTDKAAPHPVRLAGPRSLLELAGEGEGFPCPPVVALQMLREARTDAVLLTGPLPPDFFQGDLVHAPVGRWAPVVVRHPEQAVRDVTRSQFDHLLHRRIRDWSALGGVPGPIRWHVGGSLDVAGYAGLAHRLGGASRPRAEVLRLIHDDSQGLGLLGVRAMDLGLDERDFLSVDGVPPSRHTIAIGAYAPGVQVFALVRAGTDASARIAAIQIQMDRAAGLAR